MFSKVFANLSLSKIPFVDKIRREFNAFCSFLVVKGVYGRKIISLAALSTFVVIISAQNAHAYIGETFGFDDSSIRAAVCRLYALIEGAFGGLIMTVAGITAVVSAAFGAYRAATSMLVAGVGAFIIRSLVSLFFGEDFNGYCTAGGYFGVACGDRDSNFTIGGGTSGPNGGFSWCLDF